jgi:hypothetical protein
MRRLPAISLDPMKFLQAFAAGLRAEFADAACARRNTWRRSCDNWMGIVPNTQGRGVNMGQAQQNRRAVLIVEGDAELARVRGEAA